MQHTRVFAGAARVGPEGPGEVRGGLFRLAAGADAWERLDAGLPDDVQVRAVMVDRRDPLIVWAGTQEGPFRSRDGGDSWQPVAFPQPGVAIWSFAAHPTEPAVLYAGGAPATVYRSTDGGDSWHHLRQAWLTNRVEMGFPTRLIDIQVDPLRPATIWAGVEVGGVMRSADGGETWTDCSGQLEALGRTESLRSRIGSDNDSEGMLDTHALMVTTAAPGSAFLAVRMGLFRSDDDGATWYGLDVGRFSPLTYSRHVVVSPHDPRVLFATLSDEAIGKAGSLYRSDDVGETWYRYDKVVPQSTLMKVAPSPADADEVWCATRNGEVFGTVDGGATWIECPLPVGGRDVYALTCG